MIMARCRQTLAVTSIRLRMDFCRSSRETERERIMILAGASAQRASSPPIECATAESSRQSAVCTLGAARLVLRCCVESRQSQDRPALEEASASESLFVHISAVHVLLVLFCTCMTTAAQSPAPAPPAPTSRRRRRALPLPTAPARRPVSSTVRLLPCLAAAMASLGPSPHLAPNLILTTPISHRPAPCLRHCSPLGILPRV